MRFHTAVVSRRFVIPRAARSDGPGLAPFIAVWITDVVRSQSSSGLCPDLHRTVPGLPGLRQDPPGPELMLGHPGSRGWHGRAEGTGA